MYPGIYSPLHILQAEGIYQLTGVPRGETGDVEAPQTNNFRKAPEYPGLRDKWERWSWSQDHPVGMGITLRGHAEGAGSMEEALS